MVIKEAQANRGDFDEGLFFGRIFTIVAIKFTDPRIDLAPARCREKIAISTDGPEWAAVADRGGYTVQPVPAPLSTRALSRRNPRAGARNQRLPLFMRGQVISGDLCIIGINQFPKVPIKIGITRKKIIRKAWAVTKVLYSWSVPSSAPGWPSSARIIILIDRPTRPAQTPRRRYRVPISLWLVD